MVAQSIVYRYIYIYISRSTKISLFQEKARPLTDRHICSKKKYLGIVKIIYNTNVFVNENIFWQCKLKIYCEAFEVVLLPYNNIKYIYHNY